MVIITDLLEEYKELYYKEIEFNDRLNNKITTCITFLTVLGSALIFLWTQIKNFELFWYTGVYLTFCIINTVMFFICIFLFFKAYSGYDRPTFPIKSTAVQNTNVLNSVNPEQKDLAKDLLGQAMAIRFINDAIENRKLNTIKSNRHKKLIQVIMATFIITFITFAINISIDFYETKTLQNNTQQNYKEEVDINAER